MQKKKFVLVGIFFIISSISISCSVAAVFVPPGGGGNPIEKHAFFIWASDMTSQGHIDSYESKIISKGYTTIEYRNPVTLSSVFYEIKQTADYNDLVFIYITAHGDSTYRNRFYHRGEAYSYSYTTDSYLKILMDTLEAQNIAILIESCYAGAFYNKFKNEAGVMIMTTSYDRICISFLGEFIFSHHFFWWLGGAQSSAWGAFNFAASFTIWQGPCIADNADYNFF